MKKIFSPDLMFNNYIKSSWHNNLKTIEDNKIPIQAELKSNGVYAIEIEPKKLNDTNYWALALPLNKYWSDEDVIEYTTLSFDYFSSSNICITFEFKSSSNRMSQKIQLEHTDEWGNKKILIPGEIESCNMIIFSGSILKTVLLIKNILLV